MISFHFAGISWKDKITALRVKMAERKAVWFVVTALDEVACKYWYKSSFIAPCSLLYFLVHGLLDGRLCQIDQAILVLSAYL